MSVSSGTSSVWSLRELSNSSSVSKSRTLRELSNSSSVNKSRTTTTLESGYTLRGTSLAVILEGFGRRLRETAGGIGHVSEDGDDSYEKSQDTYSLDFFLSHSWHASWRAKYLCLLFHFNAAPAAIACVVVAALITAWRWDSRADRVVEHQRVSYHCLFSGSMAFLTVLLTWHHVPKFDGGRPAMFFFDKVCIHQTDPSLKEKGIKSIGAYLKHSRVLFVAWDATYFSRLWCTYELSAYIHEHPNGPVVFVPISFGQMFAAMLFMILMSEGLTEIMVRMDIEEATRDGHFEACWLLTAMVSTVFMRQYVEDIECMDDQLKNFSVKWAHCFCCDTGRCKRDDNNPTANQNSLPCDTKVVHNSIAHWQGQGQAVERGLVMFDKMIQGPFREAVKRALGRHCPFPYAGVVAVGLFPALGYLDVKYYENSLSSWRTVFAALEWALARFPIDVALLLWITKKCPWKPKSFAGKRILELLMSAAWTVLIDWSWMLKDMIRFSLWTEILWMSCTLLLVWYLYSRDGLSCLPWRQRQERNENHLPRLDEAYEMEMGALG